MRSRKAGPMHVQGRRAELATRDPGDQYVLPAPQALLGAAELGFRRTAILQEPSPMIIDCHGHHTTAPKALEEWRNRQIAGIEDASAKPKRSELRISDEELRESIEKNQDRKSGV